MGRNGDIERVAEAIRGGNHVVLSETRRAGKSTVAIGAIELLRGEHGRPVLIADLSGQARSSEQLAELLANQLAVQRHSRTAVTRLSGTSKVPALARLTRRAALGLLDEEERTAAEALLDELSRPRDAIARVVAILDDIDQLAQSRSVGAAILFDEAQELATWHDGEDLQRALHILLRPPHPQRNSLSFLFAGSDESMMSSLFATGGLLRYDGLHLRLSPLLADEATSALRRNFRALGREISRPALTAILEESDWRPLRIALSANRADRLASEVGQSEIDEYIAYQAVREARRDRLWDDAPEIA